MKSFHHNRRKLGLERQPISGLSLQPYSRNLHRCETEGSIGLFARDFGALIQPKSPNGAHIEREMNSRQK